jgi:hypothetical protein
VIEGSFGVDRSELHRPVADVIHFLHERFQKFVRIYAVEPSIRGRLVAVEDFLDLFDG